jgi:SAM-dependent methyltransferase
MSAERRYNDALATRYFEIWDTYPVQRFMHAVETRWLDELVAARSRVLVLGSGGGRELPALLGKHCRIAAVDISPAMLARGRERFGDDGIDWIEADISELPNFPDVFDLAIMLGGVLNYLPQPARSLQIVKSRLAESGRLIIGSINRDHPSEGRERHEIADGRVRALYNPQELIALYEAAGFRVTEQRGIRYFVDQLPPAWLRGEGPSDAAPIVGAALRLEEQLVGRLPPDRAKFIWTIARMAEARRPM